MSERLARLALLHLVEAGCWPVHAAVAAVGAVEVVERLQRGRPVTGVSPAVVEAARARGEGWVAARALAHAERLGARLLLPDEPGWPEGLSWLPEGSELAAPPLALLVRGDAPGLAALVGPAEPSAPGGAVAVVGARACSSYGAHVATELAHALADRGRAVVSGGAYGIDAAAHRGALAADGGVTVAVLASGVDVPYPRGNARLLEQVSARGLLVSEVLPGTHPTRRRFLVRNRLIAALARGTVVVEAAVRSGSLSTANRAAELSRPVMAVPGPVTSALSDGCHALVRARNAHLVTCVADVLAVLSPTGQDLPEEPRGEARLRDDLPELARQVLDELPLRGGTGEAALARALGVPVLVVQQLLPPLLVQGLVARSDTGWVLTPLGAGRPASVSGG